MSSIPPAARQGAIQRLLQRLNLRFPGLFVLLLVVTLVDFVVPDFIPFVDEIILALLTALFALWKDRRAPAPPLHDAPPRLASGAPPRISGPDAR